MHVAIEARQNTSEGPWNCVDKVSNNFHLFFEMFGDEHPNTYDEDMTKLMRNVMKAVETEIQTFVKAIKDQ